MYYLFVNINGSCQLAWHWESNGHQRCHTVTLSDGVVQNLMWSASSYAHGPNKRDI